MQKIKVSFLTDSMRPNLTGIGHFAYSFMRDFMNYRPDLNYEFIDYQETSFNKSHLRLIRNPFIKLKIYGWHALLPFKLTEKKSDYIFNLSGVPHPTPYRQKELLFVYDLTLDLVPETHPLLRVWHHKLLFKKSLDLAYKIVSVSQNTTASLKKYYKVPSEKIITLDYFPQDTSSQSEKSPSISISKPFILNINTIEPRKNINRLIEAFIRIKNENKIPHSLIIAGVSGWKCQDLLKLMSETPEVQYLGYITPEEKNWLYSHADIFIYPSLYEGFGIPVLEAMTYGCPVITSNTSNLSYLAQHAACMVNPLSTQNIAQAIMKVLKNPEYKSILVRQGKKKAHSYATFDKITHEMAQVAQFIR